MIDIPQPSKQSIHLPLSSVLSALNTRKKIFFSSSFFPVFIGTPFNPVFSFFYSKQPEVLPFFIMESSLLKVCLHLSNLV